MMFDSKHSPGRPTESTDRNMYLNIKFNLDESGLFGDTDTRVHTHTQPRVHTHARSVAHANTDNKYIISA